MAFWTAERQDLLRALVADGKTSREIALGLGCSRSTVHDGSQKLGLVPHKRSTLRDAEAEPQDRDTDQLHPVKDKGERKPITFHVGSTPECADRCRLMPVCSEWCREKPSKMVGAVGIEPTTSPV
jgi:hypothetical protein